MRSRHLLLVLGAAGVLACSADPSMNGIVDEDDGSTPTDSGSRDSGAQDSGETDSGPPPVGDAMPLGSISFFDRECPTGWAAYDDAVGRTIVAAASADVGVVAGTPYSDAEARSHTHGTRLDLELAETTYALIGGCCNNGLARRTDVGVSATSSAASAGVPYVQYRVCEKIAEPIAGTIPSGVTTYVEATTCPATWSKVGVTVGRIAIGAPEGAPNDTIFGGSPLASGELRTHSHSVAGTWTPGAYGVAGVSGGAATGYATRGLHLRLDERRREHDPALSPAHAVPQAMRASRPSARRLTDSSEPDGSTAARHGSHARPRPGSA